MVERVGVGLPDVWKTALRLACHRHDVHLVWLELVSDLRGCVLSQHLVVGGGKDEDVLQDLLLRVYLLPVRPRKLSLEGVYGVEWVLL